jgi:voltage-gated potassium channel Kch
MQRFTLWQRIRYRFDNLMSRGAGAMITLLFSATALMITGFTALILIFRISPSGIPEDVGFGEVFWLTMMHALDPGTVAGDSGTWFFRLTMFAVTLGGLFIVSILIGLITRGIESKMGALRKGRSLVVENGHTVILGWSPQIFSIISELVEANSNQRRSCVTVLAERDKIEMEDQIRGALQTTGRTRIVCRTGDPLNLNDLEIASPHTARAILVPSPDLDDPDSQVIKSVLALTNNPHHREGRYHIVAELRNPRNLEVAQLVGRDEAEFVLTDEVISRITVQASLQSGLSVVYTELLDFQGDEIYFHEEPALIGLPFKQALMAYEDSAPMGIRRKDGEILLNPAPDTLIAAGDELIAISEDDDTVVLAEHPPPAVDERVLRSPDFSTIFPTRVLMLGWNRRSSFVISEMDHYMIRGSELTVVCDRPVEQVESEISSTIQNTRVSVKQGELTDRQILDSLDAQTYHHVLIVSCSDEFAPQQADARTLVTLLHLRDIADQTRSEFTITSEMLDVQNRDLAAVTRADDFIVSNRLVSLLLSQISEHRALNDVFRSLFSPEGAEVYLRPLEDYVRLAEPLDFYTLVEAATRRNQIAIGYKLNEANGDARLHHGIYLNPRKSERVQFGPQDRLIVLSEG